MKYHGVRSLGARQVLTRLEPEEASLYFAGASGPIFPGCKCLAYAWSVTRDSRIVGPEAEDPGGGGVEQRPRQLARSHFRSLIEKLVRISVLVDQNSIWARRSLPVCLSVCLSLSPSLFSLSLSLSLSWFVFALLVRRTKESLSGSKAFDTSGSRSKHPSRLCTKFWRRSNFSNRLLLPVEAGEIRWYIARVKAWVIKERNIFFDPRNQWRWYCKNQSLTRSTDQSG